MQGLFVWDFQKQSSPKDAESKAVIENLPQIDKEITQAAPTWPIDKINKTDLAILRLATFELIIVKDVPFKVIVDEAIELGKEFGSDNSPEFINGVLGKIIKVQGLDNEK